MVYIVVNYDDGDTQLLMESSGPHMAIGMLTDILMTGTEDAPLQLLDKTVESVTFTIERPDALQAPAT